MAATPARYVVIQHGDGGDARTLGEVSPDSRFVLRVLAPAPGEAEALERVVQRTNAYDAMQVATPPPPGAPRSALSSRRVGRDDPGFPAELQAQLRRYYGIELRPG